MNLFHLFLLLLCSSLHLNAQYFSSDKTHKKRQYIPRYPLELGFYLGSSQFLGDLGGTSGIGQAFVYDTDWESTRPAIGFSARYSMGGNVSFRLDLSYIYLSGNDRFSGENFIATQKENAPGWFRFYRNLHFRNHVFEIAPMLHYTPINIKLSGNLYTKKKENRLAPYLLVGTGVLFHNPQAYYRGRWYNLRPLSTEGQGWLEGRSVYSVAQFFVPIGIGIQWEHNHLFILGVEVRHQITFTDYLDDVSTTYIEPELFAAHLSPQNAALAQALANRSVEHDPRKLHGYISAPQQKRGDPNNNDSYFLINIRLAFFMQRSRPLAIVKDY
jgi:hypothetical protein